MCALSAECVGRGGQASGGGGDGGVPGGHRRELPRGDGRPAARHCGAAPRRAAH